MELSNSLGLAVGRPGWRSSVSVSAAAGASLSFATVVYLALSDGGYDTITRSQVGILAWWLVLLAALAGIRPRRLGRAGWCALALMLCFAAWTAASIGWSVSEEASADQLGMVATYAGVFLLALTLQGRAAARHAVYGAAAAVGVIGLLAVLSRLHGAWFSPDPRLAFGASASRLAYPLGYWNGLGAFLAMGTPLLLAVAAGARRIALQALALAAIPVLLLGIFLADSRGGVIALGVALGAFILLTPDRAGRLGDGSRQLGLGAWILIAYADRHPIVRQGVDTIAARRAGDRMLVVLILVCAGVAMLGVAIGLVARHAERPSWLEPSRRQGTIRLAALVALLIVAALAAGVPGRLDHAWRDFKAPAPVAQTVSGSDLFSRLSSATGNSRYQYWVQAVKADNTRPLTGTGAGTFGLWWAAHATAPGHITDAHSLYMETLAETGIVGLVLIGGLVLCLLLAGAWRTIRAPSGAASAPGRRDRRRRRVRHLSGLRVGLAAGRRGRPRPDSRRGLREREGSASNSSGRPPPPAMRPVTAHRRLGLSGALPRAALVLLALAALLAVALPMAAARDLAQSRAAAGRGDLRGALSAANAAERVQPYASSPALQQALVLEQAGQLPAAREAAVRAVNADATNWQPRVVLARIEAELGLRAQALAAFTRARQLDPLGQIFAP